MGRSAYTSSAMPQNYGRNARVAVDVVDARDADGGILANQLKVKLSAGRNSADLVLDPALAERLFEQLGAGITAARLRASGI